MLFFELKRSGLFVEKARAFPINYNRIKLECAYKLDLFVSNRLIIEIKSVKEMNDIYLAQLLRYLKLSE